MVTAIEELIQIATNKAEYPDYNKKHKSKAQKGWYRYDTRFGIPVYDEDGLEEYIDGTTYGYYNFPKKMMPEVKRA